MSIAMGGVQGKSSHLFAGVNSSANDMKKGINRHLRVFSIEPSKSRAASSAPSAKAPEVKISEVSRTGLFENLGTNAYQRVVRASGSFGAVASAMGKDHQLAVFDAGASGKPVSRGLLELPREAEDIDVLRLSENSFEVAYCDKYELRTISVGKEQGEPTVIYTMPDDHGKRPTFRAIRFLTPEFILAVSNLPNRNSGAIIQCLRLPAPGQEKARLAATAKIPGKVSATGVAVASLLPVPSAGATASDGQFAIAVPCNNSSIALFTVEHQVSSTLNILYNLYPVQTLKAVHGVQQMSGVALSHFTPPKTGARPQFLKLASVTMQQTVTVHHIPLKKHVDPTRLKNRKGPPRPARYVVAMASRNPNVRSLVKVSIFVVVLLAIVAQGIIELLGEGRPIIFAQSFMPSWHGKMLHNSIREAKQNAAHLENFQTTLLSKLGAGTEKVAPLAGDKLVLVDLATPEGEEQDATQIVVNLHDKEAHGAAKTWDQLSFEDRIAWKGKLREAGAWTQHMGENVFKGVLFGELAGAVGRAVAG